MMIRIINEADENIVVYNADEVLELADEIMSLYTAEHERHRKAVGNIFNSNKDDLDILTKNLEMESNTYANNIEQIKQQESENLTDVFGIKIS